MINNKYYLIENQIFPVVSWYKYSYQGKYILFSSCDTFKKMSFRNRYVLAGSNGLIPLSVPLQNGRDQKIAFKDVRISYQQDWQKNHWRTITSCYNKAPFFNHYEDELEIFYFKRWEFLFDLNLSILHWVQKIIAHPAEIMVIDGLYNRDEFSAVVDLRDTLLPRNFQQTNTGIRYAQVFEDRIGFQANLSILDLIFNTGPLAKDILKNAALGDNLVNR